MENIHNTIITAASMCCVWTDWCCILHEDGCPVDKEQKIALLQKILNLWLFWSCSQKILTQIGHIPKLVLFCFWMLVWPVHCLYYSVWATWSWEAVRNAHGISTQYNPMKLDTYNTCVTNKQLWSILKSKKYFYTILTAARFNMHHCWCSQLRHTNIPLDSVHCLRHTAYFRRWRYSYLQVWMVVSVTELYCTSFRY
jgi:hypothetical protein